MSEQPAVNNPEYTDGTQQPSIFNSVEAQGILSLLNESNRDGGSGGQLFSEEQISSESQTATSFKQAVRRVLVENPELMIRSLDVVLEVVSKEDVREAFDVVLAQNYMGFICTYGDSLLRCIQLLYPEDEHTTIFRRLFMLNPSRMMESLREHDWSTIISEEDVKKDILEQINQGILNIDLLKGGLKYGYINNEDINDNTLDLIGSVYDAKQLLKDLDYGSAIHNRVKSKLENILLSKVPSLSSYDLNGLDIDAKEPLIRACLEKDKARTFEEFARDIKQIIPPEEYIELCDWYCKNIKWSRAGILAILNDEDYSSESKTSILESLMNSDNSDIFFYILENSRGMVVSLLGLEKLKNNFKSLFLKLPFENIMYYIHTISVYMDFNDEIRLYLANGFRKNATELPYIIQPLIAPPNAVFSESEVVSILTEGFSNANTVVNNTSIEYVRDNFGDEVASRLAKIYVNNHPENFIKNVDLFAQYLTKDELEAHINLIAKEPNMFYTIRNIFTLGKYIDKQKLAALLMDVCSIPGIEEAVFNDIESISLVIGKTQMDAILKNIKVRNPAIYISGQYVIAGYCGSDVDEEVVINEALKDEQHFSLMGNYLTEQRNRYKKTNNPNIKRYILMGLNDTYNCTSQIINANEQQAVVSAKDKLTKADTEEYDIIEFSASVIKICGNGVVSELGQSVETIEDFKARCYVAVANQLGMGDFDLTNGVNVNNLMHGSSALLVYTANFINSEPHKKILKDMMTALTKGEEGFKDWRFGVSVDNFESGIGQESLPQSLSVEQYYLWRTDNTTDTQEIFSVEADDAVKSIKLLAHTAMAELIQLGIISDEDADVDTGDLQSAISEAGQAVGLLNKELQTLRAQSGEDEIDIQIADKEQEVAEIKKMQQKMQIRYDLRILGNISNQGLSSGEVQLAGGKLINIEKTLSRLFKNVGHGQGTVFMEQIQSVLDNYKDQSLESEKISVTDTVDPKITTEIGATPVQTCQNFRSGIMNECLLGYTEPNTKIIILKDANGKLVARAILRLLEDKEGNPALHLERIYTSRFSPAVVTAMQMHAIKKAEQMGVYLYTSAMAQNEEGRHVEVEIAKGLEVMPGDLNDLNMANCRAPEVYIDSVHEVVGVTYRIVDAQKIQPIK